jgi:hypothetical protein
VLKVVSKISMLFFLVAVPFLFYGFGAETLQIIAKISLKDSRWTAFGIGASAFFPCWFAAKRIFPGVWSYLETLEHELTHLLIGLIFLKIPVGIRVSAHEGGGSASDRARYDRANVGQPRALFLSDGFDCRSDSRLFI